MGKRMEGLNFRQRIGIIGVMAILVLVSGFVVFTVTNADNDVNVNPIYYIENVNGDIVYNEPLDNRTVNVIGEEMLGDAIIISAPTQIPSADRHKVTSWSDIYVQEDLEVNRNLFVIGNISATGTTRVSTFTQGGGVYSVATNTSSGNIIPSNFDTENYLIFAPSQDITLTWPASSSLTSLLSAAGRSRTIIFENTATTSGVDITFAVGVGIDMQSSSSTLLALPILGASSTAVIIFTKKPNSDILMQIDQFQRADVGTHRQ